MKFLPRNQRGFTLIEVMLILAIAGIILTPICSFLISNVKAYHKADDQIEIQYQAQMTMNQMITKAMESKGIEDVVDQDGKSIISEGKIKRYNISKIGFRLEKNPKGSNVEYLFYEHKHNGLWFGYYKVGTLLKSSANTIYANFIEKIEVERVGGTTFEDCDSIILTITCKKNNETFKTTSQVFFRNK